MSKKTVHKTSRGTVLLIGLGCYLITMGLIMRYWAYDRLAVIPTDQNTAQILVPADGAKFFDADNVRPASGDVEAEVRVIASPERSDKVSEELGQNVVVLDKSQSTDNNGDEVPIDYIQQTVALDPHTGLPVKWDGAMQDGDYVQFEGNFIKFPFDTQKQSYQYWDSATQAPMTMNFVREETVKGTTGEINTYYFEGTVPDTDTKLQEVPRGIFGLEDTNGVWSQRSYAVTRGLWIEPETGVIIKAEENQTQLLRWEEAPGVEVIAFQADMVFTPETIQANIDAYQTKSVLLKTVRVYLPIGFVASGVVALLLAGVTAVRHRSRVKANSSASRRLSTGI